MDEATAKQIEPQVRAIIQQVAALKAQAAHDGMAEVTDKLHAIEYQLGGLLPAIHGTLRISLDSAMLGLPKTITLRAA